MDIRNWPIDRIMQLPDCCLSRRFLVSVSLDTKGGETLYDISELGLPDKTIVHEFVLIASGTVGGRVDVRLALADQLPTVTQEMDGLEPLFHGLGLQGAEPRRFVVGWTAMFRLSRLKMYVPAQGRRLVMEMIAEQEVIMSVCAAVTVSAIPTEVPDWLISGPGRSL